MDPMGVAALVVGGASGLGEAVARALAHEGAKVAILDREADKAGVVAREIGGFSNSCDVTNTESLETAITSARTAHGPARIVVNCAGIAPAGKIFGRKGALPLDDFARVININLVGSFNVMRLAVADMMGLEPISGGERGVIINTASIAAFEGQVGQCAYAASKGGVASMILPAARELARSGIRVLAIAPGVFGTPMVTGMPTEVQDSLTAKTLFPHRLGEPREYAALALHMIENQMLNGSTIRLDGAMRMEAS
ncbi:dehydrogenase [Paramagnetospirillum caucaseum]|uniref:Dehydrogenase n=1 Tax=Paramagnetospirillum caucaseum TaxID=1244869 RepID=M3A6D8_9PROT|nr:SDR family NAD(P)-dependent oxidoreductase [Paramagnetospirillum caucaseum]EME68034.1 dehydrogenase [Paramagnetospirillum caucaseum]